MSESTRRNFFLALVAIALLHTGAHLSQSFVNYPGWYAFESESFKAYHGPMSIRSVFVLMLPRLAEIVIALMLLRFRPEAVPGWVLWIGISLALGALLSTVLIQRPIHAQLDIDGNTPELVSRLIATDWIRNVLEWMRAALYLWALSRLINQGARPRAV